MKFIKQLASTVLLLSAVGASASPIIDVPDRDIEKIESGRSLYEDKIDISYLSRMVIHPKDDWIGKKVFMYNGACLEVQKDLKIKEIKEPFKNLYRSANLPEKVEIGVMDVKYEVVDCDYYQSGVTVLE